MYKLDLSSKDKKFDEDLQNKVLRELCAGARQKKWKENPDFAFIVKGVPTTKKTNTAKTSTNNSTVKSSTLNKSNVNSSNVNSSNVITVNITKTSNEAHSSTLASSSSTASSRDFISNTNFDFDPSSLSLNAPPGAKNLYLESIDSLLMGASSRLLDANMEFENTDESISYME